MTRPLWIDDMAADLFVSVMIGDPERTERIRQSMIAGLSPEDCEFVIVEAKKAYARFRRSEATPTGSVLVVDGVAPARPTMPVGGLAERLIRAAGGDVERARRVIREAQQDAAYAAKRARGEW